MENVGVNSLAIATHLTCMGSIQNYCKSKCFWDSPDYSQHDPLWSCYILQLALQEPDANIITFILTYARCISCTFTSLTIVLLWAAGL